jgi:hypothetical protein
MKGLRQSGTTVCCEVTDFQSFFFEADFLQHLMGIGQTPFRTKVSPEELAIFLITGKDQNTVGALLESL